jgi:hypothetical protein
MNANLFSIFNLPMYDFTYNIDVFDIKCRSHGVSVDLARANRLRGQGRFSAMIDAHRGARIADGDGVNEPTDRAGAGAK